MVTDSCDLIGRESLHPVFELRCKRETINTGPGTRGPEDRGPKDQGPNDLALLHLAFTTEMQLVSVFKRTAVSLWATSPHCYTHSRRSSHQIVLFHTRLYLLPFTINSSLCKPKNTLLHARLQAYSH